MTASFQARAGSSIRSSLILLAETTISSDLLMGKSTPQIPFNLTHENAVRREDLVETPANELAVSVIDAWPDWPGFLTILAGPVGSGKSHLASIWATTSEAVTVSACDLPSVLDELVTGMADRACVVVEDMDEKVIDQNALFHVLNAVRQVGGHCLVTSRSWPLSWNVTLADLSSRLKTAQLVELREPDDLLLKMVMMKLFADRQIAVDDKVLDYCVVRMERSLESAARLVAEIDAESLARQSSVTRATAANALQKLGMG
jgi:chromosomal replication initiation ATPase DnaA